MTHLALYGHVNVDHIMRLPEPPKANATVEITAHETRWGGTAGNIAAVAAHLGGQVKLATFVGHDFPPAYRAHLEQLGVDCHELITKADAATPTWWGFIDPDHNVTGILDQGPMRRLTDFHLLTEALDGAGMVHFSTGRPAYYERIAELAHHRKIPITLDPGQELRPLYDAAQLERLLELSTYYIVNHHEMQETLDKIGYGEAEQLFDHELAAIIETRGSDGAWLYTEKEKVHIPTFPVPKDEVVDTTGAGDAFRGAFHTALQEGHDLVTACRWGAAAASLNVRHVGGQEHLPGRAEIDALVEEVA